MKLTSLLNVVKLFLLALLVAKFFFLNQLVFFVHPRYEYFTLIASVLGINIALATLYVNKLAVHVHSNKYIDLVLIILVLSMFFLKPTPLSSATVVNRSANLNKNLAVTNENNITASQDLADPRKNLNGDWEKFRYMFDGDDIEKHSGIEITLEGFVAEPLKYKNDYFLITKFAVSCCIIDATPFGIPVKYPNWTKTYKKDEWLRVKAKVDLVNMDNEKVIILIPDNIEKLSEPPENPYLY
jgi:putative membrane protein